MKRVLAWLWPLWIFPALLINWYLRIVKEIYEDLTR